MIANNIIKVEAGHTVIFETAGDDQVKLRLRGASD